MTGFVAALCALLGLAIGSFLSVVVHRVPRGESVVRPRSRCPGCGEPVAERDNVPVVSWLLLRGRCRRCGAPISVRYPALEVATAALFAGTAVRLGGVHGGWSVLPAYLVETAACLALALIDLETQRLPDVITLPLYPVQLVLLGGGSLLAGQSHALLRALGAMAILYAVYFALCWATAGRGLGFGDVKLVGTLGLVLGWLGWHQVLVGVLAAHLFGGVVAVGMVARRKVGRRGRIAFGPFLVLGTFVGVLAGAPIGRVWLGS